MIKQYCSDKSPKTPFIQLDSKTGVFEIRGRSIPENTVVFYKPMFDWIDSYALEPAVETKVEIQLDYFNTSSAKIFADFFKKLERLNDSGSTSVIINWYYEDIDEDILEAGEDFQSIVNIPFELISFSK